MKLFGTDSLIHNNKFQKFSVIVVQERKGERGTEEATVIERATDRWLVVNVEPDFRHPGPHVHHPDIPPIYSPYICTSKCICTITYWNVEIYIYRYLVERSVSVCIHVCSYRRIFIYIDVYMYLYI